MKSDARYAVYLVPPRNSLLWNVGCRWLGRDAETQETFAPQAVPGFPAEDLLNATASPRMYGFHATLKAPFRLADGVDETKLSAEIARLADSVASFPMPALKVDRLNGFIALLLAGSSNALVDLERRCVVELDALRAPMEAAERARRLSARLTPRQRDFLERWGYPYVFDEFRFHMTLTERVDDATAGVLMPWIVQNFQHALAEQSQGAELAAFVQPAPGQDFLLLKRFPVGP
jgi:putative phosphonate metabolism protein